MEKRRDATAGVAPEAIEEWRRAFEQASSPWAIVVNNEVSNLGGPTTTLLRMESATRATAKARAKELALRLTHKENLGPAERLLGEELQSEEGGILLMIKRGDRRPEWG